jgi:gliding motility-associated-like protein
VYTPSGVGSTTLSYCFTNAQGCSACDQVNVTVVDPTPVSAGPNQSICLNAAPVALSLGTTDNGTWSGNGIVNSANGLFNPATAGIGLHTITLTAGTGNCQTSDQMQVTVLNVPSVNAGGNVSVCRNTSEYTIDGGVPANGTWSGSGVSSQNIAGDVVFFFDATQAPGAYNATYTIQDITTGCANSASRTINIVALPIASFSTPSVSCEDSDLNLVNNSVGATQYRWNFNGEGISNVANPQFHFDEEGPKNIQLRVLNDIGCADSTEHNTVVVEAPEADFDADQFDGCAPLTVNFEDHSEGDNLSYAWNFVNSTSTSANPAAVTFNASSITTDYLVTLTVSNACGTDTKMESVTVHPKPTASIQMDLLSTACTPVLVDIQNSSFGEVEQWSWNLDNGFTTSSQSPGEHSFTTGNSPTTYDVRLIVTNDCGSDTIVQPLVVQPNHVHASFDVNATVGCTPFTLQCTNTSQGATALHYDFASQEVSSNPNAAYTFENPGIYTVKLSATDGCGVDEMVKTIQVNQSPVSGFSMSTNEACEQSDVTFQCLSSLPDLQWNMGDGTVGTGPTFTHSFVGANDYTVSLQVTAANGCTNTSSQTIAVREKPVANFSAEYSSSCTPMEACINNSTTGADVYHWQFGLGEGSSDEISPCYTYINGTNDLIYQNIELQASNAYGCTDTKVVQVAIKPRPSGYFELSAYSSCTLPFEVQSSSTDPLSSEYSWRVNGVEVANTQDTPIQFNAIGDYEIEFFTENSFGCADSSSRSFYVYEPVEASITSSASSGCLPLEIQFSNASVNAEFMQWNFDDGGTSTELNPVHTFEEQGVFDISVVAISPDGCRDTLEVMNMIETFEKPEASFVFTPNETSIYFPEVHFTNTCSDASTVQWNFGDGDLGYGQSTVHTYEHAGQWNATQTVTNIFGCTDSKTEVVTITNEFFVYVPNAFTPDGDGINDVFKPEFEGLEFVEKYNFKIFNRWGVEVFSTDDPKMAWVGNHQGGDQYVENVAYTYRISLKFVDNVTEKILEGAVVIIR